MLLRVCLRGERIREEKKTHTTITELIVRRFDILALGGDVCKPVEHVLPRDSHFVKPDVSVIE